MCGYRIWGYLAGTNHTNLLKTTHNEFIDFGHKFEWDSDVETSKFEGEHTIVTPSIAMQKYNRPLKRVKIEKLFENLTLEERPKVCKIENFEKKLERWDSFKSYSIEIHKVHNYDDCHDGDVLPRKRKLAKKVTKKESSDDSPMKVETKDDSQSPQWDFE